jgi:hypothetical protein
MTLPCEEPVKKNGLLQKPSESGRRGGVVLPFEEEEGMSEGREEDLLCAVTELKSGPSPEKEKRPIGQTTGSRCSSHLGGR